MFQRAYACYYRTLLMAWDFTQHHGKEGKQERDTKRRIVSNRMSETENQRWTEREADIHWERERARDGLQGGARTSTPKCLRQTGGCRRSARLNLIGVTWWDLIRLHCSCLSVTEDSITATAPQRTGDGSPGETWLRLLWHRTCKESVQME